VCVNSRPDGRKTNESPGGDAMNKQEFKQVKFEREEDVGLLVIEGLAGASAFGLAVYLMFVFFGC